MLPSVPAPKMPLKSKSGYQWLTGFAYLSTIFLLAPLVIVAIVSFSSSKLPRVPAAGILTRAGTRIYSAPSRLVGAAT